MTLQLHSTEVLNAEAVAAGQDLPTPELYGIAETKDLAILLAFLASASVHWRWTSPATFATDIEKIFPAAVAGVQGVEKIPDELGDLSDKEILELAYIIERTVDFSPLNISEAEAETLSGDTAQTYGVAETSDVVRLFAQLLALGIDIRKQSTAGLLGRAVALAPALFSAMGGISEVPKEIGDLDENELLALHRILRDEFKIDNIDLELAVEEAWLAVLNWYKGVTMLTQMLAKKAGKAEAAKAFTRQLVICLGHLAVLYRLVKPLVSPPESVPVIGEGGSETGTETGAAEA